jgi:hypothetical protein
MDSQSQTKPTVVVFMQLGLLLLSVALLQQADLLLIGGMALFAVLFITAIPLAFYRLEFPLFTLRAGLEVATEPGSTVRAMFWWASIRKIMAYLGAILGAWLILVLCHGLHDYYWYALYVEATLIVLFFNLSTSKWLSGEATAQYQGLFARISVHYVVIFLLAVTFVYLGYNVVGVPDLRASSLGAVFLDSFNEKYTQATNGFIGASLGATHALSQSIWYIIQILAPGMDDGNYKLLVWLIFLLPAALQAALIIQLHLGLIALLEWKENSDIKLLGQSRNARLFFGVFLALIVGSALIAYQLSKVDVYEEATKMAEVVQTYDPCESWSADATNFSAQELADVEMISKAIKPPVRSFIRGRTTSVYKDMESHIDDYLDWYYSNTTQFNIQLLWVWDWIQSVGKEDKDRFNSVASVMRLQVMDHIIGPYRVGFARANKDMADKANRLLHEEFIQFEDRVNDKRRYLSSFQGDLCVGPALLDFNTFVAQSDFAHKSKALGPQGSGAVFFTAAVAAKTASKKLAATIVGKTAGKIATKLGLSLSSKALASSSAILTGASMGTMCGPAAPACAIVGGIAAAVVFEIAFNEADELLTRANAKSDLQIALLAMNSEATGAYIDTYDEMIDDSIMRTFRPNFVPSEN